MRISDWSSDVCSSDVLQQLALRRRAQVLQHVEDRDAAFVPRQVVGEVDDLEPRRRQPGASGGGGRAPDLVGVVVDAVVRHGLPVLAQRRSEEHTSELQSLMRHSYAVFCLKKK